MYQAWAEETMKRILNKLEQMHSEIGTKIPHGCRDGK